MNTGYWLIGLIIALFWVSCTTDGLKRCFFQGVVNAVFCFLLLCPILLDFLFYTPEGGPSVSIFTRILGLLIFGSPVIFAIPVTFAAVATFMATTNKAEKSIGQFIRNNLEK